MPAILDGIERGRVFIDLTGSPDKVVDLEARDLTADSPSREGRTARMGDALRAPQGDAIAFDVHLAACPRSTVHIFLDGRETPSLGPLATTLGNEALSFRWTSDGHAHWLRTEVRDSNGSLSLISNPIYINLASH